MKALEASFEVSLLNHIGRESYLLPAVKEIVSSNHGENAEKNFVISLPNDTVSCGISSMADDLAGSSEPS